MIAGTTATHLELQTRRAPWNQEWIAVQTAAGALLVGVLLIGCGPRPRQDAHAEATAASKPGMVAHWDAREEKFVAPPHGSLSDAPAVPANARAIVPRKLASGKGTFIDLHGAFQSEMVAKVAEDGTITAECRDDQGEHP